MSPINIASESHCRMLYLNYHCYGNSLNITPEEMGQITQAWEHRLSSWQSTVSNDENEYEFDDSDYEKYIEKGKNAAEQTTGYKDRQGDDWAKAIGDSTFAIGGAAVNAFGKKIAEKVAEKAAEKAVEKAAEKAMQEAFSKEVSKTIANNIGSKNITSALTNPTTINQMMSTAEKAGEEAAKKAGEEATKEATKKGAKNLSAYVAIATGCVTAASYWIKKPNKEEKEACDKLQTEMPVAQVTLAETQRIMVETEEEVMALSDEANAYNEDANMTIEEKKSEYDMYYATYLAIQQKVDEGVPLTDSEKELYNAVIGYMQETGTTIEEISNDTTDEVSNIFSNMESQQGTFDIAAKTMGEIDGLTGYAKNIDETTRTLCYVEGGAQGLNAGTTGLAAGKLLATAGIAWWNIAIAAAGAAAATSSGFASAEQFKWAGDVGTEIEMRKGTQDLNIATNEVYTEKIDSYDGMMQGVNDLELAIPDEIEAPVAEALPEDTGEDAVPDELKQKNKNNLA